MIGIYLHIPYCRTLCPYCDFVKKRTPGMAPPAFTDALCREIAAFDGPRDACSAFFGGGTPSLIEIADLERILGALAAKFTLHDPEITLEANPDDVTPERARAWRGAGINRVSLGVQSFDAACLRYLGRRHDAAQALRACETVAEVFETWNLDLIFGAPPITAWGSTLQRARALDPPHLAAYGLTYESGTPFENKKCDAVDDDTALRMYKELEAALAGYDHYEISNFAKPGHRSKHNLIYWRNGEYAGFGTGAYSFINGVRARNAIDTDAYLATPGSRSEALDLSQEEIRVETAIQHLRLGDGLPKADYRQRFGHDVHDDFGAAIAALRARGLIEEDAAAIRPTREGFYLNNEIGLALLG